MALLLSDTVGRTVNLATVAKKDSNNIFYLVKKKKSKLNGSMFVFCQVTDVSIQSWLELFHC